LEYLIVDILVTGAAGFIGSTLSEQLIAAGHRVTGIDCFHEYYDHRLKEMNLAALTASSAFTFVPGNLLDVDPAFFRTCDVIFHLADIPGVRTSWGESFPYYAANNIQVTQRMLDIVKDSTRLRKFVFASSSSVYGDAGSLPLREDARPQPLSPYGATKLAAEHLCTLYRTNYNLPVTSLRIFSVYGPRQRPDMAFNRFIRAILTGRPITVYGDGEQTRDFTYIDDIVTATMRAGLTFTPESCKVMNIGSGKRTPLNRVFAHLADITGRKPTIQYRSTEKGDMRDTQADITLAGSILGYNPRFDLYDGLRREYEWFRQNETLLLM
jgi:nucleoside-diphosphate-sugar epimerase